MEHIPNAQRKVKKADLFLVGGLLALCGLAFFAFRILSPPDGNIVTITVDGDIYGSYALDEPQEIPIVVGERTINVVVIEGGKAYMKEADCPDHLCMKQGRISHTNESIVCLPNRVVVSANGAEAEFDAMAE